MGPAVAAAQLVCRGAYLPEVHHKHLRDAGIDHERLTFRFQGRDYRLTDVSGEVVKGILA